ncbi:MAG: ABC transporter ATP-binding protein [Rhodospirillales bacterium]|nr:ABC transporter ATP-binding protein [Rhodospirillales bacterium]
MIKQIHQLFSLFDRRAKFKMGGLFVMMIGTALLELIGIGLFLPILQLLVSPDKIMSMPVIGEFYRTYGQSKPLEFAVIFGAVIIVFFAVKNIALLGFQFLQGRFIFNEEAEFCTRLFGAYLSRPYPFHLLRNSAKLMHNVTIATANVFQAGLLPFLNLIMESCVSLGVLTAITIVSPVEAIVASFALGLTLTIYYFTLRKHIERIGGRIHYHGAYVNLWVSQGLGAIKETKILAREKYFADAFAYHRKKQARYKNFANVVTYSPRPIIEIVAVAVLILVMVMLLRSSKDLTDVLPKIGIFGIAAFRLLPSLNRIASSLASIKVGAAAISEIYYDFLESKPSPLSAIVGDDKLSTENFAIEFQHVDYEYPGGDASVLNDISLSIQSGESTALVGLSGAGKTTLVDVLLGLLLPSGGRLLVNGSDVNNNIRAWQKNLGYVPQHIYLFDDTIRNNVALGLVDRDIDEDQVKRALKMAALGDFVESLPKGADTVLGENGVRLSGGQRQRIGIARALYNNPSILVLDEATSALDTETENIIMESINMLRGQKTLIIIAHRLSTVRNCDRLVLLNEGRLEATGTFNELLETSPLFRRLAAYTENNTPNFER